MRLECFLPMADDLFPDVQFTLDDLRSLQDNPAFRCMVARLRRDAYNAGNGSLDPNLFAGIKAAIETIGFVEFEAQQDHEGEKKGRYHEPDPDAILGFETTE